LLAECHIKEGDYGAAARAYARAVALAPGDANARARYAGVLMELGDFEGGLASARLALAADPAVPGAHLLLGQYYLGRGDVAAATRELEAESVVSPRSRRVYALLAECYGAAGKREAAAEARARYLELGDAPEE